MRKITNMLLMILGVLITSQGAMAQSDELQPRMAKPVAVNESKQPVGVAPGDQAPAFNLKNVDGKMVSFSNYPEAKGFIVIFTCNHCPYAKAYEQRIIELNDKYAGQGYPVIAINPNDPKIQPEDSFSEMAKRAKKMKYKFPYVYDETQTVARAYGATKTPHVFIAQKNDQGLTVEYIGAIDDNSESADKVEVKYVEHAVDRLLKGDKPAEKITKAVGCTIKWRKDS